MTKKLFRSIFICAIFALIGFGISKSGNNNNVEFSNLAINNVEALAQVEGPQPGYAYVNWYFCGDMNQHRMCRNCSGSGLLVC
ncbi:NVEALA domain-containing protein [Petrimonas sp.]|uniref:NVEALA domain-containing protein n=1 Tax=Petrimonas sp. TaxID=2023866 RepID=UPI003F50E1D0